MKKIGILTYHAVNNDGSVLQAFCLQQILKSRFPKSKIEIINYRSRKMVLSEWKKVIKFTPPFYRKSAWEKMSSISTFRRRNLDISDDWIITDREDKATSFLNSQLYDAIFVGSDTVWEARMSPFCPEPINIYYLRNVLNAKKIAFAASADPVQLDFVKSFIDDKDIAGVIGSFDIITVRDHTTRNYLVKQGVREDSIGYMPDPTLLYDFSTLLEPSTIGSMNPIAGISYGGRERNEIIDRCRKLGYSIFDLSTMEIDGEVRRDLLHSLPKRLSAYRDMDLLITDRFHGSIFATIFGDYPIIFLETAKKWPQAKSKGRDLFRDLGLEEMVLRVEQGDMTNFLIAEMIDRWNSISSSRSDILSQVVLRGNEELEKIQTFLTDVTS